MTTLGTLKSTIADDLARSDLTTQIAAAVTQAITYFQEERFFWTDSRTDTFPTVAAQSAYTVDDDATIPLWIKIDSLFIEDSDGQSYNLGEQITPIEMQSLLDDSSSSGRPDSWSWWQETFRFHPVPDAVYTVRPIGQIEIAAPSSDVATGNKWMTLAQEVLRCRAKSYLFLHTIKDPNQAAAMHVGEVDALDQLRRLTSKRTATGQIRATKF